MAVKKCVKELFEAIRADDADTAERNLDEHPDIVGVIYKGATPLTSARTLELAKLLVARNASIDQPDKEGHTPLYHAVLMQQPELVAFFIENGADVNAGTSGEAGDILATAIISQPTKRIVEMLLDAGATTFLPLHCCAFGGTKAIMKLLLERQVADVNEKDRWNDTPLSIALRGDFRKHQAMAALLRESGAKTNRELAADARRKPRTKVAPTPVVEIIGVHPVDTREPCHLIELIVTGSTGPIEIGEFTQQIPGRVRSDWQVPWDERILDSSGSTIAADGWDLRGQESPHWLGSVRLAFFFHNLDCARPLQTPFGPQILPAVTSRPERLAFMKYRSPC